MYGQYQEKDRKWVSFSLQLADTNKFPNDNLRIYLK